MNFYLLLSTTVYVQIFEGYFRGFRGELAIRNVFILESESRIYLVILENKIVKMFDLTSSKFTSLKNLYVYGSYVYHSSYGINVTDVFSMHM